MSRNSNRSKGTQRRSNGKGKRVNFDNERESKYEKDEAEFTKKGNKKTCATNDVSWYAHSPEMLKAASSLPFSNTTGLRLPFSSGNAVPGVMGIYYVPTIGPRIGFWDPINQAANSLYSYVVHANSRNQSYDATDLMISVLAGAQLFSFIAHGIRAYGIMRLYDQRNKYLPQGLIRAMGFDFADLRDNLSKMWFDLNELIARSDQIWIPNTIPVIERWFWMNGNIYMDGDSVKSQYYMYVPEQVYKYDETTYSTGSALVDTGWDPIANTYTWAQYMTIVNSMFDALLDSQDRGIMFGDILKAFGPEKIYRLSEIPSDYVVVPQYDTEVLTQIENSTSLTVRQGDVTINGTLNRIELTANNTSSEPTLNAGNFLPPEVVLNFHTKDIPSPEQIMVATRLTAVGSVCAGGTAGQSNWNVFPTTCGTEYVYVNRMFYFNSSNTLSTLNYGSTRNPAAATHLDIMSQWATFDWAPWMYRYDTAPAASAILTTPAKQAVGDYDNYTTIDYTTITKMHTAAVYSEFGVPTL
jgi:hypothetical protein